MPEEFELLDPIEADFAHAKEAKNLPQLLDIYKEFYGETFASWQALGNEGLFDLLIKAIQASLDGDPTPITNEDLGIKSSADISLST